MTQATTKKKGKRGKLTGSNIPKDGMMWRAITSVLNNESRSTGYGISFLKNHAYDVEFLGFVNVYVKPNAKRTIQAFSVVGMVLFHFSRNTTELGSSRCSQDA